MGRVVAGIEVEVIGAQVATDAPTAVEVHRLCVVAAAAAGVDAGHVAVELVDAQRIAELNAAYRGKSGPTDVLSFPIDGAEPMPGDGVPSPAVEGPDTHDNGTHGHGASAPVLRELGDVVICPEYTVDLREAIVHGVLHLVGLDHEVDDGEMLALQSEILRWESL